MKIKGHPAVMVEVEDDSPFQNHEGYIGAFTRGTAEGAIPNGARVRKVNSEPSDGNPDGTLGTVLGSFSDPEVQDGAVVYFVEWDSRPGMAVGVMERKVEAA